jgi:hypothetical protein
MTRQNLHLHLDSILKALLEQNNRMKQAERGAISEEEFESFQRKVRLLYETILSLNQSNTLEFFEVADEATIQKKLAMKKAAELKQSDLKTEEPTSVEEHKVMDKPIGQSVTTPVEEIKKDKQAKQKRSADLNSSLFEDLPTLGGKFETEETFHSKISTGSSRKTVSDSLHLKPIKDLKAAIGINEKFLFINKLFDGSLEDYKHAIEKINSSQNLDSAKQFIKSDITDRFNWKDNDANVKNFMELVVRRFISG